MTSRGTKEFWEFYRALPPGIRRAAQGTYQIFKLNPAHPGLSLERLKNNPRACSVRVTRDYRAVARRYDHGVWVWIWIGSHRDFDRMFPN